MRVKRFDIVFEVVISGSAGGMCGLSGDVRQWHLRCALGSAMGSHDLCSNRVISSEMTDEPKLVLRWRGWPWAVACFSTDTVRLVSLGNGLQQLP